MKMATVLRVVISLLLNKFNLQKVLKALPDNLRFGFAVTLLSFIQKLLRRIFLKHATFNNNRDMQLFVSCAVSSLGIFVATPGD